MQAAQVTVGDIVEGKVAKIMNYGAFVDLAGGGSGMIHISEVANSYVKDINEFLKVGDDVRVKVIGINEQNKVSLSIKALQEKPAAPAREGRGQPRSSAPRSYNRAPSIPSTGDSFEDMMNRFKRSSDDKLSDLKRTMEREKACRRTGKH